MLSGGQSVDNFYGSVIFFTSFMILVEMIILNLLFALIIDLYFQLCKKPHDRVVVHYTASGSTNIEVCCRTISVSSSGVVLTQILSRF